MVTLALIPLVYVKWARRQKVMIGLRVLFQKPSKNILHGAGMDYG